MHKRGSPMGSGLRTTRQPNDQSSSRQQNRGGIQKRQSTPRRADRDGDVNMDGPGERLRGGRAATSERGASIRSAGSQRHSTPEATGKQIQDTIVFVQQPPASNARIEGSVPSYNSTFVETLELMANTLQTQAGRKLPPRPGRSGMNSAAVQRAVAKEMGITGKIARWPNGRPDTHAQTPRDGLATLKVDGLRRSKASANDDGGVSDLIAFLERKATHDGDAVRIRKSRMEHDTLIVFARPVDAQKILKLNNFTFAGTQLKITEDSNVPSNSSSQEETQSAQSTIEVLKDFLSRRYNQESKLLDLSKTGSDDSLVKIGMFNTISRESKFFPALMKICEGLFESAKDKEDAVVSVSLAQNALPDIGAVTSLAQTFPNLKNIDLSSNQISDRKDLEGWRWKFPKLNHIILTDNPIEERDRTIKQELMRWYPALTLIDGEVVRSPEQVEAAKSCRLPLQILGPNFRDEGGIGETFVKQFFAGFDTDRAALVKGYYDDDSTFSLSVNTSAPRAEATSTESAPRWDKYIHSSRNLTKITTNNARRERLCTGSRAIRDCFEHLPVTRHPDLLSQPEKWCIECTAIPGLPTFPQSKAQAVGGVGGLLLTIHGEFSEAPSAGASSSMLRSFDRTFVLGPGEGIGGVRIICDTLMLRAYGGHGAWRVEGHAGPQSAPSTQSHQVTVPPGFGEAAPEKGQEQVQKEVLALELSKATGLTLEYSGMCLEQSGWTLEAAYVTFEQAKVNLPAEAFLKITP